MDDMKEKFANFKEQVRQAADIVSIVSETVDLKRKGSRYRMSPRLPRTAQRFGLRSMGRRSSSRQRMARKQRKVQSRKKLRRNTQWRCTTM